ncbi:MAG: hypothetical protein GY851_27355 [bacterium]|nr:hypothetical protein [bacterium]
MDGDKAFTVTFADTGAYYSVLLSCPNATTSPAKGVHLNNRQPIIGGSLL